jgi:hypothetical protein
VYVLSWHTTAEADGEKKAAFIAASWLLLQATCSLVSK